MAFILFLGIQPLALAVLTEILELVPCYTFILMIQNQLELCYVTFYILESEASCTQYSVLVFTECSGGSGC